MRWNRCRGSHTVIDGSQAQNGLPGYRAGTETRAQGQHQEHSGRQKQDSGHRQAGERLGRVLGAPQSQASEKEDDAAEEQHATGKEAVAELGLEGFSRGGHVSFSGNRKTCFHF